MLKTLRKNIFRSPYQSLSAVLVISLALFLINIFFLIGAGSGAILTFFESRPQVIAYLKDEVKPQDINLLKAKIESNVIVKKIDYVSKEDALALYKNLFKDKPVLLEMVSAKYLPASLEVSTTDITSLKTVAEILKKEPSVEDVDYQEDVISTLSSWLNSLRKFGFVLVGYLFFTSVLIVLVILGMKISQRKTEIETLKLIGASSFYISLPLYVEGIFYGLVSAIISWGVGYLLILYLSPFLIVFLSGLPIFPIPVVFMLELLAGLSGLGILAGFLGSFLAVFRFMRTSR